MRNRRWGIAEEVAETFPELVVYDEHGAPETVRYQALTPILLNEVQALRKQVAELADLKDELAELRAANQAMQAALMELAARERQVAQR